MSDVKGGNKPSRNMLEDVTSALLEDVTSALLEEGQISC